MSDTYANEALATRMQLKKQRSYHFDTTLQSHDPSCSSASIHIGCVITFLIFTSFGKQRNCPSHSRSKKPRYKMYSRVTVSDRK
ncbi:unnamed protein product [Amoebophrya sp. A25]|nr:unnamed protein product [Amoebophrya sp. A25]|eukprot:GSA25T00022130001.1